MSAEPLSGELLAEIRVLREKGERADALVHQLWARNAALEEESRRLRQERDAVDRERERLELALSGARLSAWDWNVQSGAVVFNEQWGRLRGYQLNEVAPHVDSWKNGVHPDDWNRVQQALNDHFEGRTPVYVAEHRVLTKSGEWIWLLDRGSVFERDSQGRPVRMVGTELDITERKLLEEALHLSEERLALAVDASGQGLWDWNLVTDEAYLSPRYWQLIGYEKDEVPPGFDWFTNMIHPDDRDSVFRTMQAHLRGETPESVVQYRVKRKSGEYLWINGVGRVTERGPDGAPLRMTGVVIDISAQKRIEADLRGAVESRDNLLAVVSHDLRSPLSAIHFSAKLLQRAPAEGERRQNRRQLEVIARAVDRMNHLIDDLLQAATIEAGTFTVQPQREEVRPIVDEVLQAFESHAQNRGIHLSREVAERLPPARCDRLRVAQVLTNLIGNALKFAPADGHVQVRVWDQAGEICFAITDDGPGIAPEQAEHVFDRYWTGESTARGAGLGLYIAKGIVDAHQGRIWLTTEPGAGSTFGFSIPADERPESFAPSP
jgi:PAS domain S-box-containing protein